MMNEKIKNRDQEKNHAGCKANVSIKVVDSERIVTLTATVTKTLAPKAHAAFCFVRDANRKPIRERDRPFEFRSVMIVQA